MSIPELLEFTRGSSKLYINKQKNEFFGTASNYSLTIQQPQVLQLLPLHEPQDELPELPFLA